MSTDLLSCFKHAIIIIARNLSYLFLNEVIIMRRFYSHLPYYLVIFFFYWPLYELFSLLSSDSNLLGLYLLNIFIFSPLVTFIVSLLYGYHFHFSLRWLLNILLLFCFTIIPFQDFSIIYFLAYEIFAIIGMASGIGIKRILQKMKNKKLSQNP